MAGVHAFARVMDFKNHLILNLFDQQFDFSAAGRVFDGVADKINQALFNAISVRFKKNRDRKRLPHKGDLFFGKRGFKKPAYIRGQMSGINGRGVEFQFTRFNLRHVEKVAHQPVHPVNGILNLLYHLFLFGLKIAGQAFSQVIKISLHDPDRRSHVMRHHMHHLGFKLIHFLQAPVRKPERFCFMPDFP